MAKPIELTPIMKGDDAKRLLASLEKQASPDELARRQAGARAFLAAVMKPKGLGR